MADHSSHSTDSMVGKTIAQRYKIIEQLGEGGMGVVYKAKDLELKREVALKFLKKNLVNDADAIARFEREALAASNLNHPNIGQVYNIDNTEERSKFIVMCLYDGKPLSNKIVASKLDIDESINFAIQIASGLAETHKNGIVHRDLKPSNIIVTKDNTIKIIDFGLAKLAWRSRITKTGSTWGTPPYMSPEQVKGEKNVDHRTDIWSLGVIMYELLADELPFKGDRNAIFYAIETKEPRPLDEINPQIPSPLRKIVRKALEKNPDKRYGTMQAMLDELHTFKTRKPSSNDMNPNVEGKIQCYVSFDLGSETMAAYYEAKAGEDRTPEKQGMVQLQKHGRELLGVEPASLKDSKGNDSPRLKTRISLEDGRQGEALHYSHARLEFLDQNGPRREFDVKSGQKLSVYENSLFKYFHKKGQEFSDNLMPNPKIPFQEGAKKIIPRVVLKGERDGGHGKKYQHDPQALIQHLTTQVVRNFILKSPELRLVDPKQIHLTLTMPNVYSLIHVEKIRNFVERHAGVAKVEAVYESDAVTYSIFDDIFGSDLEKFTHLKDFKRFKRFREKILNSKERRILTIDIGRGTTDLSLIQIENPKTKTGPAHHAVLARTGKSDGGNRLSYILAEYYNDQLKKNFARSKIALPFDLIRGNSPVGATQGEVLVSFEELIENIKKNFGENYGINFSKTAQQELMAQCLRGLFDPLVKEPLDNDNMFANLKKNLLEYLPLPPKLPGKWLRWLLKFESIN